MRSRYLPLAKDGTAQEAPPAPEEASRGTESILFVDDEPALVDIGEKRLSRLGYTVKGVTSALDALEAFKSAPGEFDLLITDFTMPKMTGVQLAKEILALKPGLPIILCTGFSERLNTVPPEEIGVVHLVMKPLMASEISRAIRKVLHKE